MRVVLGAILTLFVIAAAEASAAGASDGALKTNRDAIDRRARVPSHIKHGLDALVVGARSELSELTKNAGPAAGDAESTEGRGD